MNNKKLSPKQLEALKLAASGYSNKEIARKMDVCLGMLGRHLKLAREKLNSKTTNQAIYEACKKGLICFLLFSLQGVEMRGYFDTTIHTDFTRARRVRSRSRRREDGTQLQHNFIIKRSSTI